MLSDEEKQELRDLAASSQVREEFRLLRRLSRERRVDADELIRFLNFMARLSPTPPAQRRFKTYHNVKL